MTSNFYYINLVKLLNYLSLIINYLLSLLFHKNLYGFHPSFISVEISSICNLKCPQCDRGKNLVSRKNKFFDFDDYKKLLEVNGRYLINTILYFQGEPLLNPQFFDFVTEAGKYGIYTQTSTNGQLINDEMAEKIVLSRLDKIIVSVDGTTEKSYSKYRVGGSLEKCLAAMDNISKAKSKYNSRLPVIEAQFIVFAFNENEIEKFKDLCSLHKADRYTIKSAQLINPDTDYALLPKQEKYRRYKYRNGKWVTKKGVNHPCFRAWSGAVVNSDGDVVPCCFDKQSSFIMGNIKDEQYNYDLSLILKNRKSVGFRKKLICDRKSVGMCNNCNE